MSAYQSSSEERSLARPASSSEPSNLPEVRIGTSGWHYEAWRGPFYPEDIKTKDFLSFYITRFSTTELNNPFYRLPTEATVQAWRKSTPEIFLYAWKASRLITHLKRLKEVEENVPINWGRCCSSFRPRSRPTPSGWRASWTCSQKSATHVRVPPPELVRAADPRPFGRARRRALPLRPCRRARALGGDGELRLHPCARAERALLGQYSDETLRQWADDIAAWRAQGRAVYCYFDNDIKSAAPADAQRLFAMLQPAPIVQPAPARLGAAGASARSSRWIISARPRIAKQGLDRRGSPPDDLSRLVGVEGDEAAPELGALGPRIITASPREKAPSTRGDAGRQQALAAPQRCHRAGIDDDRAARLQRAGDPCLARRGRVRRRAGTRCSAPPASIAPQRMIHARPPAITMWVPPAVGDLGRLDLGPHAAARKLRAGAAGHRLDRRRDAPSTRR